MSCRVKISVDESIREENEDKYIGHILKTQSRGLKKMLGDEFCEIAKESDNKKEGQYFLGQSKCFWIVHYVPQDSMFLLMEKLKSFPYLTVEIKWNE